MNRWRLPGVSHTTAIFMVQLFVACQAVGGTVGVVSVVVVVDDSGAIGVTVVVVAAFPPLIRVSRSDRKLLPLLIIIPVATKSTIGIPPSTPSRAMSPTLYTMQTPMPNTIDATFLTQPGQVVTSPMVILIIASTRIAKMNKIRNCVTSAPYLPRYVSSR